MENLEKGEVIIGGIVDEHWLVGELECSKSLNRPADEAVRETLGRMMV